ncbi:CCA tRNA nucleotidyltransferase [Roseomonas oryzicola]|uniref:CCA tRNA nucleotidyltransferase n=1 Tax=Neoroseomonas oryzicola TaxID=535904 RepID=A0A9X9WIU6_9PROT|nr:CCA tRNA nucleotidyltransferase [Neoroseomonas oryzicola]MBR0660256.1 CCA tRNA nucleotidyltransferase [Neoroseomonas oryzicola]NKE16669.1 CCA tRNA nucleotidyltransferase [Neoroseomonas oryzicola]
MPGARAVGGCVRDALAGRPSADVDVAAPLPPEEIAARLREAGLKVFETGLSHGTVTAVKDHVPVEVTALRRDVLTDGRHAQVEWTTDWREDAARRDFTINAMSLAPDGSLYDYFTGRADLAAGTVRFVGDPDTRLAEDYLRALRFFRFQARYGLGAPDAPAIAAIRRAVPGLARLSAERVWMELKRILMVPDPVATVALMAETGVLAAVLPEAEGLEALRRLVAAQAPADPLLRLAALIPDGEASRAARLRSRLHLSGAEADALTWLMGVAPLPRPEPDVDGDALRIFLARREGVAPEDVQREAWLAEARDGRDRTPLRARIAAADWPRFPLQGRDALALGAAPGPAIGRVLGDLRAWWIEGGCRSTRDEALAELARRIGGGSGGTSLGG